MHASYRRLQQYAIAISILSIIYNGAEGAISIAFGSESSSRSLIFFGLQSGLEVISASLVVWRFRKIAKPGEEKGVCLAPRELRSIILYCHFRCPIEPTIYISMNIIHVLESKRSFRGALADYLQPWHSRLKSLPSLPWLCSKNRTLPTRRSSFPHRPW